MAIGALLSELPSLKTGFTALPFIESYLALIFFSITELASFGYFGILYPSFCNSVIAFFICGIDALIFGSFMIFACGFFH